MYIFYSVIASTIVVAVEAYFRHYGTWPLWMVIPSVLVNLIIFKMVTGAPSFLIAFLVFSLSNVAIRIAVSHHVLHETIPLGTWAAMGMLVGANIISRVWR